MESSCSGIQLKLEVVPENPGHRSIARLLVRDLDFPVVDLKMAIIILFSRLKFNCEV